MFVRCRKEEPAFFRTRGLVLLPEDLTLADWPQRAQAAGLTTVALHATPHAVATFIASEPGQQFLAQCRQRGLQVEYELHAMADLLPRALFQKDPRFFRMNENGERTPDANLCVRSERALEIVCENAVAFARTLRPTTGRYFYWGDDVKPWCRCPACRSLSDAEQAVIVENRLLKALREVDSRARVSHLAYQNTLWPPTQVRPESGIFLEYAPILRRYEIPYAQQNDPAQPDPLQALDANLELFDVREAQALEYWLDVSRFSRWKRPAVRLPWKSGVFAADLDAYGARGIRHITTFAAWIDAAYVAAFGEPPLQEYGAGLANWRAEENH